MKRTRSKILETHFFLIFFCLVIKRQIMLRYFVEHWQSRIFPYPQNPENSQPWQWLTAANLPLFPSSQTLIPLTIRNSLRFPFDVRRIPLPMPRTTRRRRRRGCRSSRRGRPKIPRAETTSTGWARRPKT